MTPSDLDLIDPIIPIDPIVIVGAGAAGLLAAVTAASAADASTRVLLLERTRDGGRKILLSGGGRCNVLPSATEPARFVTDSSPNTLRKLLLSWPLAEQRRFFEEEAGIPLALEPETGKLFPASNRARDVRDRLLALAKSRGVEIRYGVTVDGIEPPISPDAAWTIRLAPHEPHESGDLATPAIRLAPRKGGTLRAAAVVLATGGLSMPGTGSDGTGLGLARRLGHTVRETYPALTPLTAAGNPAAPHAPLAGLSAVVTLRTPLIPGRPGTASVAQGGFLFTHRGYSGPAVLDLSHRAVRSRLAGGPRQPLLVQWTELEADAWDELLRTGSGTIAGLLRRHLPERLATTLAAEAGVEPG
ncbi:MAG TPA: NAD(P)/FAD-dependent oxidoreductase, partial [Thermoanaerobaculia bacterium]|nr:NAD(P)/FAD-dependent oxidoreductase [Thermoanaerobaculia bacterium]